MKRGLVNGLVAASIVGAPLAGHTVLSGIRDGMPRTAFASEIPVDRVTPGQEDRQVTPRTPTPARTPTPTPAATVVATPIKAPGQAPGKSPAQTPGKAPAQTAGKAPAQTTGKAPAQTTGKAPSQAPSGTSAAPAQAPRSGAAPVQAPRVGAAPAHQPVALPRTGGVPLEVLALIGTTILGAGVGLRRFRR